VIGVRPVSSVDVIQPGLKALLLASSSGSHGGPLESR
jgi:hypothetical protein